MQPRKYRVVLSVYEDPSGEQLTRPTTFWSRTCGVPHALDMAGHPEPAGEVLFIHLQS